MKIFIFDSIFSLKKQKNAGMASKCVSWQLKKNGHEVVDMPQKADFIFATAIHPNMSVKIQQLKKYHNPVIVGGYGAYSPLAFTEYADAIVIGDGEKLYGDLKNFESFENVWVKGKSSVGIDHNFPFDCPPIQQEDGTYSIFCGRGCKNKCFFCQTGWGVKYSESDKSPAIMAKRLLREKKKISYLSNDLPQHSFFKSLPSVGAGSYSVSFMRKNGLPKSRLVRIGVEGVSERLRKYVSKPISSDDLVKCSSWLSKNKKGVRWFMIAGLPTETKDDWEELKENILKWKRITEKGVLEISFTAWCPVPATPLSIMPITDEYYSWFKDFEEWFFHGVGFSNRIKVYKPEKPENRLKKAINSMWLDKKQLYSGGRLSPNFDIVEYPFKAKMEKISKRLFREAA